MDLFTTPNRTFPLNFPQRTRQRSSVNTPNETTLPVRIRHTTKINPASENRMAGRPWGSDTLSILRGLEYYRGSQQEVWADCCFLVFFLVHSVHRSSPCLHNKGPVLLDNNPVDVCTLGRSSCSGGQTIGAVWAEQLGMVTLKPKR